jgi:Transglutaminase-like superfamily
VSPDRAASPSVPRSARYWAAFAFDLGQVLWLLPRVERGRRRGSPGDILEGLRTRGKGARARSERSQRRLARAIGWVDRLGPGGPNCLRRALLRVALDPEAATEEVVLGLNVTEARAGGRSDATGHAWVGDAEPQGRYEVEFRV